MTPLFRVILFALACSATLALWNGTGAARENVVEVPILGAIQANDRGVFEVMIMRWDNQPDPDPIALQIGGSRVTFVGTYVKALKAAFTYALGRTPSVRHTGTLTLHGLAYMPTSSDGPSAGAAMTVGFIAVLKGESIQRGVAITGTIESNGRIGPVGGIADKVRAAAREGYRTVLIPQGQLSDPRWNLSSLALDLNMTVKEVGSIDEAYELMTGRRL
jgi:PDZ domain-containing protein